MSIVEMQKVHIVSTKENKDAILKTLRDSAVLDIQAGNWGLGAGAETDLDYRLAELKSAITFLEAAEARKKSFIESFLPAREETTAKELNKVCQDFDCRLMLQNTKNLDERLANLKNLTNELHNKLTLLAPWQSLKTKLNDLNNTEKIRVALGSIKTKGLESFRQALDQASKATTLTLASQTKESTFIIITFLTTEAAKIEKLMAASEFNPITLPLLDNTAKAETASLNNLLKETKEDLDELHKKAKRQAQNLKQLKFIYDNLLEQKHELEVKQKLANTNYAFVIEGWIKKSDLEKLRNKLGQATEVLAIEPAKDEKPPVILSNPKVLAPFELITQIYGSPQPTEFDPSVPLSFFFALFFGLCLGDFGYGLALSLVSLYFLKRYKLPAGGTKLFQLLMLGGGTAMIVGLLTGAYFGFSPAEIPVPFLKTIQIIDPIKNPLTMLVFSLALGVVQILFGILLQMALHIRNKEYLQAILDDGIWFVFLSSLVLLIVASALSLPIAGVASKLSLAGAAGLILTQGRHKKTIIQKFLSGLLSLYKVSGYMGDTLSYSRLLALGMSSTIIGSVINILAGMVKGSGPVIGIILMVVLLVFGHLFNLIISTLSAFVHSTRLQMVEFFSKFYEGGGREFRPYKRVAEYTTIK
ncbi:hypothetical protein COT42_08625 [Candidatus Saganbacteria bacterium CG08_land_8_20_14_0_20_45_16]|uniref:Uncharacterized protein n=1 Tax=Candidatus Saganbacteria bacterium CG08_land_8_20_14_0_20_45_16 TaxID=2014293 RepID=A0A2H0XTL0_UNCSA|nr:MAG: hypothetical protein COT42_08625 [Candidatus Saganbacteria bacterium CG08_land_8_20_14_0_20_45_16]